MAMTGLNIYVKKAGITVDIRGYNSDGGYFDFHPVSNSDGIAGISINNDTFIKADIYIDGQLKKSVVIVHTDTDTIIDINLAGFSGFFPILILLIFAIIVWLVI